jgi:hypothetical protein
MNHPVSRTREELLTAVSQLERMGFTLTGQWARGSDSMSQLDVLVHDSFPDALYFLRTLFGYTEIMSSQRMSIGVVQYRGAPLLLRLHRAA